MDATSRMLLVVEDNRLLNQLYKNVCELAVHELSKEGLSSTFTIKQAHTYMAASDIIKSRQELDFMSVDLSLREYTWCTKQNNPSEKSVDGMLLLKELRESGRRTIAIVVFGEGLLSHAMDTLRKYRVLAYFEKSRFDLERYKHALKAALWSGEVARILQALDQGKIGPGKLGLADMYWKKALESTKKAGIDERNLPDNLDAAIESARRTYAEPAVQRSVDYLEEQNLERTVGGK